MARNSNAYLTRANYKAIRVLCMHKWRFSSGGTLATEWGNLFSMILKFQFFSFANPLLEPNVILSSTIGAELSSHSMAFFIAFFAQAVYRLIKHTRSCPVQRRAGIHPKPNWKTNSEPTRLSPSLPICYHMPSFNEDTLQIQAKNNTNMEANNINKSQIKCGRHAEVSGLFPYYYMYEDHDYFRPEEDLTTRNVVSKYLAISSFTIMKVKMKDKVKEGVCQCFLGDTTHSTCTWYSERNLNAYFAYTMTMEKSGFYPYQTSLVSIRRPRGKMLSWSGKETRTKNLELGIGELSSCRLLCAIVIQTGSSGYRRVY